MLYGFMQCINGTADQTAMIYCNKPLAESTTKPIYFQAAEETTIQPRYALQIKMNPFPLIDDIAPYTKQMLEPHSRQLSLTLVQLVGEFNHHINKQEVPIMEEKTHSEI